MFEKDPAEFLVTGEAVVTLGDLVEGQVFQVLLQEPPAGIYIILLFLWERYGVKNAIYFFRRPVRSRREGGHGQGLVPTVRGRRGTLVLLIAEKKSAKAHNFPF